MVIYTLLPIQDLLVSVLQSLLILDTASLKLHVLALETPMLGRFRQLNVLLDFFSYRVRVVLVGLELSRLVIHPIRISDDSLASHLSRAFDLGCGGDIQE